MAVILFRSRVPTEGTSSLCLSLGSPCPKLLSHPDVYLTTRPLTVTSSSHPSVALSPSVEVWPPLLTWRVCVSVSLSSLSGCITCPASLCSFRARFPWTTFCTLPRLSLPPWRRVSFSLCRNSLSLYVHKEACYCSSKFSLNVIFFAKPPPTLLGSNEHPFFVRAHVSLSEFPSLCAVIICFCICLSPRWAFCRGRILGYSFSILSRLH